jgi:rhomboid protease GluP
VFRRKTTGSVVCPNCGSLVGVRDEKCYTCGRANPGLWGFAPALRDLGADFGFVPLVIGASVIMYLASLLLSGGNVGMSGFAILSPSGFAICSLGASGAWPVFFLEAWWTVLSATWLHGGLLHILFNMMAVRNLGPAAVDMLGPARTVIVYVIGGACGFLLSSLMGRFLILPIPFFAGARLTVGASAAIFALVGALVHYGRASGSGLIRTEMTRYALLLFVSVMFLPNIDNYAHLGGFLGGYATSRFLNPLARERGDHMIVAVLCLVATALAVVASLYTVFSFPVELRGRIC